MASETAKSKNRSLEGLRGFSAAIVVLYHVFNMGVAAGLSPVAVSSAVLRVASAVGPFGVDLFFIISGYLILQSLSRHGDVRRFLTNRALRIYPAFLPLHLLIFLIGPLTGYAWMAALRHDPAAYALHFASNLAFLPGLAPFPLAQKNAWSLSYEWGFYLTSCFVFAGIAAFRAKKRGKGIILSVVGASAAIAAIAFHPVAAFFLVGVAVFLTEEIAARYYTYRPAQAALGLVFLVTAFSLTLWSGWGLLAALLPAYLCFFLVVREHGAFSALLRTTPFRFLGRISYSLYLVHPFVLDPLRALARALARHGVPTAPLFAAFAVMGVALSIVIAYLLWRVFEVALTNRLKEGMERRQRRQALPRKESQKNVENAASV